MEVVAPCGGADSLGQDTQGRGRLARPLGAAALAEKLSSGRDKRPGQNSPGAQERQAPGVPAVPGAQPAQSVLIRSAEVSLEKAAHAAGRSGGAQVRGTQISEDVEDAGCVPGGQAVAPTMHCSAEKAPVEAVVVPSTQGAHTAREAPPVPPKKRPNGQFVGAVAPAPSAYVPEGAGMQATEPGGEKVPATQMTHVLLEVAPEVTPAFPAGHARQEKTGCPGTLL